MARKKTEGENEAPKRNGRDNIKGVRSTDEARKRGRNGGIKSGEVRRAKKTMRETVTMLMEMPAVGSIKSTMNPFGMEDGDKTNMAALVVKLYAMALNGNLKAAELLAQFGGLTQDEIRKDNEDKRKEEESKARIAAIQANLGNDLSISSGDDDGDVIIYVPNLGAIKEVDGEDEEEEVERGEV